MTKTKKNLKEIVDNTLDFSGDIEEKSPQSVAVESLISVSPQTKGEMGTDVEIKTDLDENSIKMHTVVEIIGNIMNMSTQELNTKNIILELVQKLERKALSKDRKSRTEIVEIARIPNMNMGFPMMGGDVGMQQQPRRGFRRLFGR